jgi:hypothetical protein
LLDSNNYKLIKNFNYNYIYKKIWLIKHGSSYSKS